MESGQAQAPDRCVVSVTDYDEATRGLSAPRVVRVRRDVPNLNGSRKGDVSEEIYLKVDQEMEPELEKLIAGSLSGVVGCYAAYEPSDFDGLLEKMGLVGIVLDMEVRSTGPCSPITWWITKRVWVPEDSRVHVALRALIDAAEAKAKAEAAALESPVGGYSCCSPTRKHHEPSQHYEPSQPAYSATSPNYNPRAPCYSGSRPTAWSPTAPRYSPNSPQQEPNSPMS